MTLMRPHDTPETSFLAQCLVWTDEWRIETKSAAATVEPQSNLLLPSLRFANAAG